MEISLVKYDLNLPKLRGFPIKKIIKGLVDTKIYRKYRNTVDSQEHLYFIYRQFPTLHNILNEIPPDSNLLLFLIHPAFHI